MKRIARLYYLTRKVAKTYFRKNRTYKETLVLQYMRQILQGRECNLYQEPERKPIKEWNGNCSILIFRLKTPERDSEHDRVFYCHSERYLS